MLGIFILPKAGKHGTTRYKAMAKEEREERRRKKKIENSRNETKFMGDAIKAIEEFFGMKRATRREVLAAFVEASEHHPSSARDLRKTDIPCVTVNLHIENNHTVLDHVEKYPMI